MYVHHVISTHTEVNLLEHISRSMYQLHLKV